MKVLIVDDEYTMRELVSLSLEPDYEVIKAEDGIQGLEEVKKDLPDLIILDIMMPKLDGFEFCRRMKGNPRTEKIPILMLTAKHQVQDLQKAVLLGVDEYITKPFEPDMLKKRVDAYLKDGKDIKQKLMKYGKALHYVKDRQLN